MQGAEERRLRRISNTPQGEATEGNTADDSLMVDQGSQSKGGDHETSAQPKAQEGRQECFLSPLRRLFELCH